MKEGSNNGASFSLRDFMKGTWREDSFIWDPKRYVKGLEMGICFHMGLAFGEHGGGSFLRAFERKKFLLRGIFVWVLRKM
jgi:hypothetical protein